MAENRQPENNALDFLNQDASAGLGGFEQMTAETLSKPYLRLAQKMSKAVEEADDAYIEGLKPGYFYDTATRRVFGTTVDVVIAGYSHVYFEYNIQADGKPDKAKVIATHLADALRARRDIDRSNFKMWITQQGTGLVEAYVYYVVIPQYADEGLKIFSVTSTGIPAAKAMNTLMCTKKLPDGRAPMPHWMVFTLTSKPEQKDGNTFHKLVVSFKSFVDKPTLAAVSAERTAGIPRVENETGAMMIGYDSDDAVDASKIISNNPQPTSTEACPFD